MVFDWYINKWGKELATIGAMPLYKRSEVKTNTYKKQLIIACGDKFKKLTKYIRTIKECFLFFTCWNEKENMNLQKFLARDIIINIIINTLNNFCK